MCKEIRLIEEILMNTLNIPLIYKISKYILKSSPFVPWSGAMINPYWLEIPMLRTNFQGPKDNRAIAGRRH